MPDSTALDRIIRPHIAAMMVARLRKEGFGLRVSRMHILHDFTASLVMEALSDPKTMVPFL